VLAQQLRELRGDPRAARFEHVLGFAAHRVAPDANAALALAEARLPGALLAALLGHARDRAALGPGALDLGLAPLVAGHEVAHLVLPHLQRLEHLRVDLAARSEEH